MVAKSGNEGMDKHRSFLPLGLLLLALTTVFVFGGDRGHFYRPGHHDWVSSEHLAVAVNLSPEHGLLMFHRQFRNWGGGGNGIHFDRAVFRFGFHFHNPLIQDG